MKVAKQPKPPKCEKEILQEGDGKTFPQAGQTVRVHYTGKLLNGKVFDSSIVRKEPFEFQVGVGQVIKGWDIIVSKMSVGEKCHVKIPYQLAYGEQGAPPDIPPRSVLAFDIELLAIVNSKEEKKEQVEK